MTPKYLKDLKFGTDAHLAFHFKKNYVKVLKFAYMYICERVNVWNLVKHKIMLPWCLNPMALNVCNIFILWLRNQSFHILSTRAIFVYCDSTCMLSRTRAFIYFSMWNFLYWQWHLSKIRTYIFFDTVCIRVQYFLYWHYCMLSRIRAFIFYSI